MVNVQNDLGQDKTSRALKRLLKDCSFQALDPMEQLGFIVLGAYVRDYRHSLHVQTKFQPSIVSIVYVSMSDAQAQPVLRQVCADGRDFVSLQCLG